VPEQFASMDMHHAPGTEQAMENILRGAILLHVHEPTPHPAAQPNATSPSVNLDAPGVLQVRLNNAELVRKGDPHIGCALVNGACLYVTTHDYVVDLFI
jgi:hypothetical protein